MRGWSKRKLRGTKLGISRGVSALYHFSSQRLRAERVGSGLFSGRNGSKVTVTFLRGANRKRLAAHSASPRRIPFVIDGSPSAHENMLPHRPRVRARTTVTFGTAARTSAAVRA